MNQCKTSWKWSSLTIVIYWYILILKHFYFLFCIFFSLLTSGKGLMDYKHQHTLAVEQRFSADSYLSMKFRGFIPIWKTSDPEKGHAHWQDLRHLWDFLSLLTVQDHILGTGSPCPTLAVGCCSLSLHSPVLPGHGLYQVMLTCRGMFQPCLNLSSPQGSSLLLKEAAQQLWLSGGSPFPHPPRVPSAQVLHIIHF